MRPQPIVEAVLKLEPALANSVDSQGLVPLHLACAETLSALVPALLAAGARADAPAKHNGRTPIDDCAAAGDPELVTALVASLPEGPSKQAMRAHVAALNSLAGSPMQRSPRRARIDPLPPQPGPQDAAGGAAAGGAGDAAGCVEGGGWDVEPPPTEAQRAECQIDQRVGLSADDFFKEYFLPGRPVLLRDVMPLRERCAFARAAPSMAQPLQRRHSCGRTAYPNLTGQRKCGAFTLRDLNSHPACADKEKTRPICVQKPGGGRGAGKDSVNTTECFKDMPTNYRYEDAQPPPWWCAPSPPEPLLTTVVSPLPTQVRGRAPAAARAREGVAQRGGAAALRGRPRLRRRVALPQRRVQRPLLWLDSMVKVAVLVRP